MRGLFFSLCLILVAISDDVNTQQFYDVPHKAIKIHPEQISAVVREFEDTMEKMILNFTAYKKFERNYMSFAGEKELDGRSLVNEIAGDINIMLKRKIKAVKELVKVAQDANLKSVYDEMIDYDYLNNKKLLSDDDLYVMNQTVEEANKTYNYLHLSKDKKFNNEMVNFDLSTVHVPTNVFDKAPVIQNGVKWSEALDEQFKKNHDFDMSSKWQYFCSSDGFFRVYPGMKWPKNNTDGRIDTFDCRIRSWYIKAATSPKNIIILVDKSGSMKGLRMKITHSTVDKILQTLSDEDHFNIIKFSDEPSYADEGCTNNTLIHASASNKRRMLEKVKNIRPEKRANFTKALIEAFELFMSEESNLSNQSENWKEKRQENAKLCNKAIMLITDGAPESYEKVFEEYNWVNNKSVRVFTFLIGREVSDSRNAKWMADANRGYYTHISTLADVQENVQEYIKVMSRPLALSQAENHVWTSLYADYVTEVSENKDKGLQYITSFAAPVYDTRENHTEDGLLGVAGTDVTVKQIQELIPYNRLGPNAYAFVVTHQGYVLFHPNFHPSYLKKGEEERVYHPDFQNVDITEVEYAEDEFLLNEMRKKLISGKKQEQITLVTKMPYDEGQEEDGVKKRISMRNYTFYFSKINDTDFSLGIALAQKKVPTAAYNKGSIKRKYFRKNENTEIAPWRYCKYDWTDTTDLYNFFKKIFTENGTLTKGCSDDSDSVLLWDLTRRILKWWEEGALYHFTGSYHVNNEKSEDIYQKFGIEQVFFWTSAGITKYIKATPNISEPNFIKDNIETIKNKYYRQAVEGVEHGYKYTYSVPFYTDTADRNKMVVTITAPIYPRKFTVGVVGLQLKYMDFVQTMEDAVTIKAVPLTNQQHPLSCKDSDKINCYILDSNGYILYANTDSENNTIAGKMLTDKLQELPIDTSLMDELVNRHFFKKEQYLNRQVMCSRKLDMNGENSAAFLLNPFKRLLHLVLWMFTETVIFLFEWSWFTEQHNTHAEQADCYTYEYLSKEFNIPQLPKEEKNHVLNVFKVCDTVLEPCSSFHTRYMINYSLLQKYKDMPFTETLSDCGYCLDPRDCIPACNRTYTVQWINNTNMMFVAVAAPQGDCWCTGPPVEMDEKKEYDGNDRCEMLLEKTSRTRTRKGCIDYHPNEPKSISGQMHVSYSHIVLAVTFMICVLTNQKCV